MKSTSFVVLTALLVLAVAAMADVRVRGVCSVGGSVFAKFQGTVQ